MNLLMALVFVSLAVLSANYKHHLRLLDEDQDDDVVQLDLDGTLKRSFAAEAMTLNMHGNVICSPLSALLPLGKLILGTDPGKSLNELLKAVGTRKIMIKDKFKSLFFKMRYLPGVTLSVASRIYIGELVVLNPQYEKDTKTVFLSSVEKLDFSNPWKSAKVINSWVSSQTNGKIKDIVTKSDINRDTKLMLVNAIYFSGRWNESFKTVFIGDFHTPSGTRKVPMMTNKKNYNYVRSEILNAKIVEIPYEGKKASFILVLPNSKNGLPMLFSGLKLAPELLNNELKKMQPTKITLTMPKFKIETELDLKTVYQKIGVNSVFTRNSGLTGISKNTHLVLSKAIQKAYIEVTEKGSEAAAASVVETIMVSSFVPPEVKADHPFLFYVLAEQQQLFAVMIMDRLKLEITKFVTADHPFIFFIRMHEEQVFAGILNDPK